MAKSLHQTVSFAGGETSPKVAARADQAKYSSWLRENLNMIAYRSGGLTRAPGTQFIATAKYATSPAGHNYCVREMSFIFSPATCFMLEFGNYYIRFYSNGQQVNVNSAPAWASGTSYVIGNYVTDGVQGIYYCILATSGTTAPHLDTTHWVQQTIYEVPSPYPADALTGSIYNTAVYQIVPCQINDVVYIVHPDYPPYALTQLGTTDWTMKQVAYLSPALLDQNATDTVLTPSQLQGTGITLTASAPVWVSQNYYNLANSVEVSGVIYDCILANVSSASFATDLAAGYWQEVSIFNSAHIGSTWQLAVLRASAYIQWGADAGGAQSTAAGGFSAGTSSQIQCLGAYEVHTYGVWTATIELQRSLDGGQTFDTVLVVTGNSDRNVDETGTAGQLGIYQLVVIGVNTPVNPGATAPRVIFECDDAFLYGLVQITGVTGPYAATGNVITQLTDSNDTSAQWVSGTSYSAADEASYLFVNYTAINNVMSSTPPPQDPTNWAPTQPGGTEYWSEAAWSNYRGFPQAICSFQQRIIYASSGFEPQRIWGTVTNDIENFALGDQTLATDAFAFDLNAPSRGPIAWLTAQTDLFAGFSGAEWVINSGSTNATGGSSGAAITPTNINAFEQGTFGSAPFVQPLIVGNAVMFAQRQADALRQMLFSVYTEKYMSSDLTAVADHLFPSGIVQLAYQSRWHHQGIVWALTQQGTICGLTYDLDQEVFGWCRRQTGYGQSTPAGSPITSDNGFESVCVIDGQATSDDEVWVVANRLIKGVQTRFIERMNPINWEEIFTGAPNPPAPVLAQAYYVDCGTTVTNPGTLTIPGLGYLAGRYVVGLADGNAFGPVLVSPSGTAQLPNSIPTTVGTVQIGLPISYAAQIMAIDSDPRAGNTQGLVKQVSDAFIRVWNSCGGSISNGTTQYAQWMAGNAYLVGNYVISPLTGDAYFCLANYSGLNDPATEPSFWTWVPLPVYSAPVPITYTPTQGWPGGVPQLVTNPTDIRITPMLNISPNTDPQVQIVGNDAKPLTVLGLFLHYDVTGVP